MKAHDRILRFPGQVGGSNGAFPFLSSNCIYTLTSNLSRTLQLAFSQELMALDNNSPVQLAPSSVSNSPAAPTIAPPATPGSSDPPATLGAGGDPPAVQPVTPPAGKGSIIMIVLL